MMIRSRRLWITVLLALPMATILYLWVNSGDHSRTADTERHRPPIAHQDEGSIQSHTGIIFGNVTSNAGRKVNPAIVCATGTSGSNRLDEVCIDIEEDGTFELELPAIQYRITVSAKGHVGQDRIASLEKDGLMHLQFRLDISEPNVGGVVTDTGGEPLKSVKVAVFQGDTMAAHAITGADGSFATWVPPGPVRVTAVSNGFTAGQVLSVAPALDLSLRLLRGYSVSGKVINAATNAPIQDVRVIASRHPEKLFGDEIVSLSQEDGEFVLGGLKEGETFIGIYDEHWTFQPAVAVTLGPSKPTEEITLLAQPGALLKGRLRTGEDYCREGQIALYELQSDRTMEIAYVADTVERGFVDFPALPFGSYWVRANCNEQELVSGPRQVDLSAPISTPYEWVFTEGNSINVVVKDGALRPLKEAVLHLDRRGGEPFSKQVLADNSGAYTFGGLAAGSYFLEARAPGISGVEPITTEIEVLNGMKAQTVDMIFPSSSAIQIKAQTNPGLAATQLFFYAVDEFEKRYEAIHQGDGIFEIMPIPGGRYKVFQYDSINPEKIVSQGSDGWVVVEPSATVQLAFEHRPLSGRMSGHLLDDAGSPVPGAKIKAFSEQIPVNNLTYGFVQEAYLGPQLTVTDEKGGFNISGLSTTSEYVLQIQTPDGISLQRDNIMADDNLVLTLPEMATLSGKVVDENGDPANKFVVEIYVRGSGAATPIFEYFDTPDGHYLIENIVPSAESRNLIVRDEAATKEANSQIVINAGMNQKDIQILPRESRP